MIKKIFPFIPIKNNKITPPQLNQIYNGIYQNKFIKSIQRPLQNVAAFGTYYILALTMNIVGVYTIALI